MAKRAKSKGSPDLTPQRVADILLQAAGLKAPNLVRSGMSMDDAMVVVKDHIAAHTAVGLMFDPMELHVVKDWMYIQPFFMAAPGVKSLRDRFQNALDDYRNGPCLVLDPGPLGTYFDKSYLCYRGDRHRIQALVEKVLPNTQSFVMWRVDPDGDTATAAFHKCGLLNQGVISR
jgi:hypothetical protein